MCQVGLGDGWKLTGSPCFTVLEGDRDVYGRWLTDRPAPPGLFGSCNNKISKYTRGQRQMKWKVCLMEPVGVITLSEFEPKICLKAGLVKVGR